MFTLITSTLLHLTLNTAPALDSIGVERQHGKRYVLHRVSSGQTLYSIARRYASSVDAVKAANPDLGDAVRYNQVIRVPVADRPEPAPELSRREERALEKARRREEKEKEREARSTERIAGTEPTRPAPRRPETGLHTVEAGQTLYSLAGRYNVPMSDLRRWNNLSSDNVQIGQTLIVTERAYLTRHPTPSPAKAETARVAQPVLAAAPAPRPEPAKPDRPTPETPAPAPVAGTPLPVDENRAPEAESRPLRPGDTGPLPAKGRHISEIGWAELIEGDDSSTKYLALHRTAPVGSLVQVRNDFTNQNVWVKVIGRLPDTGVNDRILIKLSAQAFAKLSPHDRRFRAEVSYVAP